MTIKNRLIKNTMQLILFVSAFISRRQWLNIVTKALMTTMAYFTIYAKRIKHVDNLKDLAHQWQRGFPSAKQVPVKEITDTTVIAEIQTPCPLRGTNDVKACYRMMQYDRAILKKAGGQFVVLKSQATPGNINCRIAIRKEGYDISDLKPAHK